MFGVKTVVQNPRPVLVGVKEQFPGLSGGDQSGPEQVDVDAGQLKNTPAMDLLKLLVFHQL